MGLFDIFGTGDQRDAANSQIAGINAGIGDLNASFGQGRDALSSNYTSGLQPFLQNYQGASSGTNMLGNALGLNGAAGGQQALQAFQQSNPGYGFQLQQGENAVLANQAKSGQLASGNTNLDLQNYGQGLANQTYGNWVNQLQPYLGAANSAATGVAGVDTGLGNQLNANFMGQGNANYGAQTSIGNANANANLAGLNASANGLGAIGGAAGLGANLFGAFLSDERAKDDIEPVGELYDGQQVYRYRYKGDPRHQIGLIAQEVERAEPGAVVEFDGGWKGVNYKTATDRAVNYAEGLLKFAA